MKLVLSLSLFGALAGVAPAVPAQLRLPSLPSLPALAAPSQLTRPVQRELAPVAELGRARTQRIAQMLRERRAFVEADPAGQPMVRSELILSSPSSALLDAARAEGFGVVRDRTLDALEMRLVTLHAPPGWDTPRALRRLREIDPHAVVDFNHLYLESGDTPPTPAHPAPHASAAVPALTASRVKVGLIDAGVETEHAALRGAAIHAWGCGGNKIAHPHGTAVASLLVGRAEHFRSAAPGATLYAADVYCNDPIGGSTEAVAAALAWLLGEHVPVVNISLVGPANRTLEQVVRRASAKGMLLVAAVGNDGPAAAPLYPAAYPEVVAVTAVDARGQVIPEAGRGAHVAFAAPGAEMAVAASAGKGFTSARGTSFAAPLVAGLLAASMHTPDVTAAARAVADLARSAVDAGAPGRDPVYGHGLVARDLRSDPALMLAAGP